MKIQNHRKLKRYVSATTAIVLAALLIGSAWTSREWRQDAFSRSEEDLRSILSNASRNVVSSIELSDAIVTSVDRNMRQNDRTVDQMKLASANIAAVSSATSRIQEIIFAESGGWVLASSIGEAGVNRNVGREAFFRKSLADPSSRFQVTRSTEASGGVVLSRRASLSDGTTAGVVAAIVPLAYFQRIWSNLDAGRGLKFALRSFDGSELANYAPTTAHQYPGGIVARRQIDHLPLTMEIQWPLDTVLADWWRILPYHIATTAFIAGLVLLIAHLVLTLIERSLKEQQRLTDLAETDALTGLGNRRALMEALREAANGTASFSLLLLDLDRFKAINDLNGHLAGDAILAHVGRALRRSLPQGSRIARLGGDEFAAVIAGANKERLAAFAIAIMHEVSQPVEWLGAELNAACSVGISTYPHDGATSDLIFQAADLALYQAKSDRTGYRLFQNDLREREQGKRRLEADLKTAIEQRQIVPYYQPVVCLKSGRVVGFEILARWNHPQKGVLPPSEFIALAEERKLITPLTISLLETAIANTSDWPADIRLAVNISPQQLREPLLAQSIFEALRKSGFDASRLEIEITEDAILDDYELAKSVMSAFRLFGATIALDDFGTGYSSLAHLRELRFDKLKIDRSFIKALPNDKGSATLVETIAYLATSFDLHLTAEGVETEAQADFLRQLGCTYGQGYLYGRPCDAAASQTLLVGRGQSEARILRASA